MITTVPMHRFAQSQLFRSVCFLFSESRARAFDADIQRAVGLSRSRVSLARGLCSQLASQESPQ